MSVSTTETQAGLGTERGLLTTVDGEIFSGRAPGLLRKQYRVIDDAAGWRTWRKHLAKRDKPRSITELFPGKRPALLWAVPVEPDHQASIELIDRLAAVPRRVLDSAAAAALATEAENWLWSSEGAAGSPPLALESLAWAHALPKLATQLPAALWWRMLARLVQLAGGAERIDLLADPLAHQLTAGELPLVLAYQFPELQACRRLRAGAGEALARGMTELLDGEGVPQSAYWGLFRPLLACWTRSRAVGGKHAWDREAEKQFGFLVQEGVRLSLPSGEQILTQDSAGGWSPKLFKLALRLADDPQFEQMAARNLPGGTRPQEHIQITPAMHSEWAEVAVLQPNWKRGAPKLTVVYGERRTLVELEHRGELVLSGRWELELRRDGELLEPAGNWEEVCWVSDEDVDYVEIEAKFTGGMKVQRQILLAREDRCLLLLDSVLGDRSARLDYVGRLPFGNGVSFEPAAETRDGWLSGRKSRLAVLPMALSEWRVDARRGELAAENGELRLGQSTVGRSLCAPLLIDLDAKRAAKGVTWRQLTVAELRQVLPADAAAGYRAQCGKAQWLIYRSLTAPAVRTVLGQNLSTEFLFGRFQRTGDVKRLLEIE